MGDDPTDRYSSTRPAGEAFKHHSEGLKMMGINMFTHVQGGHNIANPDLMKFELRVSIHLNSECRRIGPQSLGLVLFAL